MKAPSSDLTSKAWTDAGVVKATARFEVRRMKAAEASADLDEAEWEEVNFYQRERGGGGGGGGGGVFLMTMFLSLIAGCSQDRDRDLVPPIIPDPPQLYQHPLKQPQPGRTGYMCSSWSSGTHKQQILAVSFLFATCSFGRTAQTSAPTSFQLLRLECSLIVWGTRLLCSRQPFASPFT